MDFENMTDEDAYAALIILFFLLEERAKYQEQWEKFENEILYSNRFFVESEILKEIESSALQKTFEYQKGTLFYRARIYNRDANAKFLEKYKEVLEENGENFELHKKHFTNPELLNFNLSIIDNIADGSEMDKFTVYVKEAIRRCKNSKFKGFNKQESLPPFSEKCTSGRANPEFIRYLYVCEDELTPIYEVKPSIKQNISLAKLRLKRDIRIYDFPAEYCQNETCIQGLFSFIAEKFSIPNYNEAYKYIPTQYITEKIKKLGFDGIRFNSSLNEGGKNLVLFNIDDCEVISTSLIEVADIKIEKRVPGIYGNAKQENPPKDILQTKQTPSGLDLTATKPKKNNKNH